MNNTQAAERTLAIAGSEHGGAAHLSADLVATDEHGRPVISVIHLDDRRHWNLVVSAGQQTGDVTRRITESAIARELDTAADGDVFAVESPVPGLRWAITVEVLEPAPL